MAVIREVVERRWREPDRGNWAVRGQRQHFTFSKVSARTAVDRTIKLAEATGRPAPLESGGRRVRHEIHADVRASGFDKERNSFVQYYGATGTRRQPSAHLREWLSTTTGSSGAGNDRCQVQRKIRALPRLSGVTLPMKG